MKDKIIGFRATQEERKRIEEMQVHLNFGTISQFIRKVILDFIDNKTGKKS